MFSVGVGMAPRAGKAVPPGLRDRVSCKPEDEHLGKTVSWTGRDPGEKSFLAEAKSTPVGSRFRLESRVKQRDHALFIFGLKAGPNVHDGGMFQEGGSRGWEGGEIRRGGREMRPGVVNQTICSLVLGDTDMTPCEIQEQRGSGANTDDSPGEKAGRVPKGSPGTNFR